MGGYVIEAALLLLLTFVVGCGIGYAARHITYGRRGTAHPPSTADSVSNDTSPPAPVERSAPVFLDAPRAGGKDDLQRIAGIGPKIERSLNEAGIYHLDQIAALSVEDQDLLNERLRFHGRIRRDDWVGQAARLLEAERLI